MGKNSRHFIQQTRGDTKVSDQQQPETQTEQNQSNAEAGQDSTTQTTGDTAGADAAQNGQEGGAGAETTSTAPVPGVDPSAPSVGVTQQFTAAPVEHKKPAQHQPKSAARASSQNVTVIEQQLVSYMDGMQPSLSLDPKVGGQYQNYLFGLLRTVLNNQDQDQFRREWNTILNVFNKNKEGVFHENYIMRFPQHWNLSDNEGALFRRLIAVIIQTAEPKNRASFGSNVRLDTVVEGMNETQKNNFLNFYA